MYYTIFVFVHNVYSFNVKHELKIDDDQNFNLNICKTLCKKFKINYKLLMFCKNNKNNVYYLLNSKKVSFK